MFSKRFYTLSLMMALLFALTAGATLAPTAPKANDLKSASALPDGLQQAILETTTQPFAASAEGYRTHSGGLDLTLNASGLQADSNGIAWGIALSGFGRGEQISAVVEPSMAETDGRLEYRRGAITEWYRDTALGIQQGFTIHKALAGKGQLVLQLDLSTDLEGTLDEDGRGLSFRGTDGLTLRYDHMRAWDASGRELDANMLYIPGQVKIQVWDEGAAYPITIDPLIYLEQKVIALDGAGGDYFGHSVALSGDTALVGAPWDDVGANINQGSAYVFVRSGTTWTQQAKLSASDGAAEDRFGYSVAVSGDTALVGAFFSDIGANMNQGSTYVFVRNGTTWSEQQKLTASDGATWDEFGVSVALSGDTALVGAYVDDVGVNTNQGSAYVFMRNGTIWSEQAKLTASDGANDDYFGYSVALSGNTALVGAHYDDVGANSDQGSAYTFVRSGTTWSEQQHLTALDSAAYDYFGWSVALSGNTALVGSPYADIGANSNQGAAYTFVRSGTTWSEQQKLTASDGAGGDAFGWSVALSGDTALMGAYWHDVGASGRQGSAYVFVRNGTTWSEQQILTTSDGALWDYIGHSVALSGNTALVGAYMDDVGANLNQGSAYFYQAYRTDSDLAVSVARGTNDPVQPGDTVLLTVSVMNYGPASASSVMLDALLPAGLTYVSHAATHGAYTPATGLWNVGNLAMGVSATLTIEAIVDSITDQTLTFTASVLSRDTNDANNTASLDLYVTTFQEIAMNGGFNNYAGASKIPQNWVATNFAHLDGKNTTSFVEGTASVKIYNAIFRVKTLTQTQDIEGDPGDLFHLSFWVRGISIPARGVCRVQILFYNNGMRGAVRTVNCPTGTYRFQQKMLDFTAPNAYTRIVIRIVYSKASGSVFFDGLSLLRAAP